MKVKSLAGLLGAGLLGLTLYHGTLYEVREDEQVVVNTFGKPTKVIVGSEEHGQEASDEKLARIQAWNETLPEGERVEIESGAGLYFKLPFVQSTNFVPDTIQEYDKPPRDINTADKKKLSVDAYSRWRIDNPVQYLTSVVSIPGAISKLDSVISSEIKSNTGRHNLIEIVRDSNREIQTTEERQLDEIQYGRSEIMDDIADRSREQATPYGIDIVDVRIKRTDLPDANKSSVFERMNAERNRIAQGYRSEGNEEAEVIRSDADRQVIAIRADGYRQAEEIRGVADAKSLGIYNQAYGESPDFFNFWRTMETYRDLYGEELDEGVERPRIVMDGDSQFVQYLKGARPKVN